MSFLLGGDSEESPLALGEPRRPVSKAGPEAGITGRPRGTFAPARIGKEIRFVVMMLLFMVRDYFLAVGDIRHVPPQLERNERPCRRSYVGSGVQVHQLIG